MTSRGDRLLQLASEFIVITFDSSTVSRQNLAESEWHGRVRMEWPSSNGMTESEWNGRVRMGQLSPNGLAEFPWSSSRTDWPNHRGQVWIGWSTRTGRIRMSRPNHPGRVRLAGRITLVESDWLAESD